MHKQKVFGLQKAIRMYRVEVYIKFLSLAKKENTTHGPVIKIFLITATG